MMAIYPETPEPFECAICHKTCPPRWQSPQMKDMPPLCWLCEQDYGTGPFGDPNPDRRIAKQISALAEALTIEAHRNKLGLDPLYGRT